MTLRDLFNLSLINRREQVALEWKGREYTFGEIDQRSDLMAASLSHLTPRRPRLRPASQLHRADRHLSSLRKTRPGFRPDKYPL